MVSPDLRAEAEVAQLIRSRDWSSSPIGHPRDWPANLRTLVGVMLNSRQPMFITWGCERTMLYNDGYAPILGLRHPAAMGRPFLDVWHEIVADVEPILDRAYAGEAIHMDDIQFIMTRNGFEEETHFAFSYTPVRDEHGTVEGMFCACTETTEVIRAQRRKNDEQERLRRLFAKAPGFIAVVRGQDYVFEMANESYLALVGGRDVVGKPLREALPEIEGQGLISLLDEVWRTRQPFRGAGIDVALRRSEHMFERRMLDFVFQPIVDVDGSVSGVFVEGYDVTERYEAEQALRESEERFRQIADLAPVPMWVTKLDRTRGFVNQAYADFLGVSYEEALHFDWRAIIHPDDAERLVRESIAGEASLETFRLEARYRRGDGQFRWLRSESQPRWDGEGKHLGFIGVATDISEAKQSEARLREMVEARTTDLSAALTRLQTEIEERSKAEEALRQAQKMEAVGRLTGGIAHDFNNLLTPIVGGLQLIERGLTDPKLIRIARTALEGAQRGAKLTSQLLAFSRVQRISMTPINVNDVISGMRELLRQAIGDAVSLELHLDDHAGHAVCDANQLENALLNLAINARDAMPEGGALTISTRRETLCEAPDLAAGDYVAVVVGDTGGGMSAEIVERATEPFFSTKPLGKGTGLGLAQVYGIALQSGGALRIDSVPGEGTNVTLLLPAITGRSEEAEVESAAPGVCHRGATPARIAVIDDDAGVREFLCNSLEELGYEATAFADGPSGLAAIAKAAPDLVVIDYAMPGMNGAEVVEAIAHDHPGKPVLLITGFAETRKIEAALGAGVPLLRKPFGLPELAAAVRATLGSGRSGRP